MRYQASYIHFCTIFTHQVLQIPEKVTKIIGKKIGKKMEKKNVKKKCENLQFYKIGECLLVLIALISVRL